MLTLVIPLGLSFLPWEVVQELLEILDQRLDVEALAENQWECLVPRNKGTCPGHQGGLELGLFQLILVLHLLCR